MSAEPPWTRHRKAGIVAGMAESHEFGRLCEDLAAEHLTGDGWTILARNYRSGHREIDIIAERGSVLAFIEVKGRRGAAFGHPLESITHRKRREIERVASQWIARHGRPGRIYRFDALAVSVRDRAPPSVHHLADAWRR